MRIKILNEKFTSNRLGVVNNLSAESGTRTNLVEEPYFYSDPLSNIDKFVTVFFLFFKYRVDNFLTSLDRDTITGGGKSLNQSKLKLPNSISRHFLKY